LAGGGAGGILTLTGQEHLPMRATRFNHVSVPSPDLENSAQFYEDMFGMTRIETPNFGFNVLWLKLGDQQLHLFQLPDPAHRYAHFGLDVTDFDAVYDRAKAKGVLTADAFNKHYLFETPFGQMQMYIRDPFGNLIEVNWPDANTIRADIRADAKKLVQLHKQSDENLRAVLYVDTKPAAE
jgi:catechol 2,3-dioxygenase-like lactoylglutathione lyase family enzyme